MMAVLEPPAASMAAAETCSAFTDDDDIVFVFRNVFAHRLTSHHEEHHIAQAAIGHGQHPKVAKEYENHEVQNQTRENG